MIIVNVVIYLTLSTINMLKTGSFEFYNDK